MMKLIKVLPTNGQLPMSTVRKMTADFSGEGGYFFAKYIITITRIKIISASVIISPPFLR
jgi:hypothetical protein